MKFGIFYEHQLPRPWAEDSEYRLLQDALDQIELADRLGYDYAWEVEHHFLEEYSHSSAPEVFLAAASQRTKQHPPRPRHHPAHDQPPGARRRAGVDARPAAATAGSSSGSARASTRHRAAPVRPPLPRQARGVGGRRARPASRCSASERWEYHGDRTSTSRCATSCPSRARSRTRRCGWRARQLDTIEMAGRRGMGALGFQFVSRRGGARLGATPTTTRSPSASTSSADYETNPNIAVVCGVHVRRDRRGGQRARPTAGRSSSSRCASTTRAARSCRAR